MMTRKHYEMMIVNVAAGMNVAIENSTQLNVCRKQAAITLRNCADDFAKDNPRFDRQRFARTAAEAVGGVYTYSVINDEVIRATDVAYTA